MGCPGTGSFVSVTGSIGEEGAIHVSIWCSMQRTWLESSHRGGSKFHVLTPYMSSWAPHTLASLASNSTGMAKSGCLRCQGDWTSVAELYKDYSWPLPSSSPACFPGSRGFGSVCVRPEGRGSPSRELRQMGSQRDLGI